MKLALSLVVASFVSLLAGCNTMEGAGKDIQRAGEKLESAAKKK
jgi:predicted small secreted protein